MVEYVSMRDFSPDEICHYLLNYDITDCTHKFVHINLKNDSKEFLCKDEISSALRANYPEKFQPNEDNDTINPEDDVYVSDNFNINEQEKLDC